MIYPHRGDPAGRLYRNRHRHPIPAGTVRQVSAAVITIATVILLSKGIYASVDRAIGGDRTLVAERGEDGVYSVPDHGVISSDN